MIVIKIVNLPKIVIITCFAKIASLPKMYMNHSKCNKDFINFINFYNSIYISQFLSLIFFIPLRACSLIHIHFKNVINNFYINSCSVSLTRSSVEHCISILSIQTFITCLSNFLK